MVYENHCISNQKLFLYPYNVQDVDAHMMYDIFAQVNRRCVNDIQSPLPQYCMLQCYIFLHISKLKWYLDFLCLYQYCRFQDIWVQRHKEQFWLSNVIRFFGLISKILTSFFCTKYFLDILVFLDHLYQCF